MSRPVSLDLVTAKLRSNTSHQSVEDSKFSSETGHNTQSNTGKNLATDERNPEVVDIPETSQEDLTPPQEPSESEFDLWAAFSLLSNGRKVFGFEDSINTVQSLYGIKFLTMCWVLISQSCSIIGSLPAVNYVNTKDVSTAHHSNTY
jgi:hypothetical protein